jgi:hypothetical protein
MCGDWVLDKYQVSKLVVIGSIAHRILSKARCLACRSLVVKQFVLSQGRLPAFEEQPLLRQEFYHGEPAAEPTLTMDRVSGEKVLF